MSTRQKLSGKRHGFTLVEMIAVLAIMAILASAIAPNIASQLKRARSDAEDATLANISKLLTESVTRNRTIPGSGTWDAAVAAYSSQAFPQIGTNEDNFARVFVPDPSWAPAPTLPPAAGWNQTPAAAWALSAFPPPANCRILLISGGAQNLSAACGGLTSVEFGQIWNTQGGPAACQEGNDVRIGRINLTALFQQVTITSTAATGYFNFDGATGASSVNFGATSRTFPVISGTRLSLLNATNNGIVTEIVVNRPLSASWDGANWTVL